MTNLCCTYNIIYIYVYRESGENWLPRFCKSGMVRYTLTPSAIRHGGHCGSDGNVYNIPTALVQNISATASLRINIRLVSLYLIYDYSYIVYTCVVCIVYAVPGKDSWNTAWAHRQWRRFGNYFGRH